MLASTLALQPEFASFTDEPIEVGLTMICLSALATLAIGMLIDGPADTYQTLTAITYKTEANLPKDQAERLKLDIYYPKDKKGFATVVWFHGGGLTGGDRYIPNELKGKGIAIVAPSYRLNPTVKSPVYIEDAAAAAAWVFRNIDKYGGTKDRIFISGHSAGGYLTLMLGLDQSWLKKDGVEANSIAGLIPFSPQCITHFTVRKERGIRDTQPIVDKMAPLYHVRGDAPPLLLITGDRNLEMLGRYEENAYMWRMMKLNGHKDVELCELQGFDHGNMPEPAFPLLLRFIEKHSSKP